MLPRVLASKGDKLQEMENYVFWKKKKNISVCHLLKILPRVLSVNFMTAQFPIEGGVPVSVEVELWEDLTVVSQMQALNKTLPVMNTALPPVSDKTHLQYLMVGNSGLKNGSSSNYFTSTISPDKALFFFFFQLKSRFFFFLSEMLTLISL